jgi:hypothetical protein
MEGEIIGDKDIKLEVGYVVKDVLMNLVILIQHSYQEEEVT